MRPRAEDQVAAGVSGSSARAAELSDPGLSAMLAFARDAERTTEEEIRAFDAVPTPAGTSVRE